MAAPIIMVVLLTAPFAMVRLIELVTERKRDRTNAAAVGLALLFVFTGSGHFVDAESMTQMLPEWVPGRLLIVYITGVLEFALAAGFILRNSRRTAGWVAAVLLVLFFPANIYAAIHHAPQGGHAWGPGYLLIRGPLQLFILLWDYWFLLRKNG